MLDFCGGTGGGGGEGSRVRSSVGAIYLDCSPFQSHLVASLGVGSLETVGAK